MTTPANYVFLPWVRQGAASVIQTPDSLSDQAGVASVTVTLRVNDTDDISQKVRLYGPGDVIGIDPQQVVRTEPRHLATDFEPNYFPAIDFDRPDFPWLFTPAAAAAEGKLRPWLCLVVVRKQKGVTLRVAPDLQLPVLEIKKPALAYRELPDLSESWAWAHAQITGSPKDGGALEKALAGEPALTVSRLLCPRRLDPSTEYLACVVPSFASGSNAGLGPAAEPDDDQQLKPAWMLGTQSPLEVTLPVYFHWEFRTGTGDDFEQLVRSLRSRPIPSEAGKRPMDISHPGFRIPLALQPTLELEGALRVRAAQADEWPETTRTPFQQELRNILNAPALALKEKDRIALVAPPIYGSWQAARHTVEISPASSLTWLDELNLDPRQRVAAALGAKVVQTQQEQLVASAWEQLGEIERINQMRRQAQLGRSVNAVYHAKHFMRFSAETLLKVVAPAQSRVVLDAIGVSSPRALLSQRISKTAIPARAVSAPVRRLTSPRGAVSARFLNAAASPIAIIATLNTTTPIVRLDKKEAGLVTINEVSNQVQVLASQVVRFKLAFVALDLDAVPPLHEFKIFGEGLTPPLPIGPGTESQDALAFRQAAQALQDYILQAFLLYLTAPAPAMALSDTKDALLQNLNPENTIKARIAASLRTPDTAHPTGDPLEPILDAPDFPQPMYEALRDISQDFLFPGLEHVESNTVALLETNPKFVESFLVGLNAEMSRELLWRNYPTDQRGTYFRQFWDTSAGNGQLDINEINTWGERKLGDNAQAGGELVLLIRGDMLRRYPNAVIYAVEAGKPNGQLKLLSGAEHERHPLFRGTLKPDITFLGFDLTKSQVTADPGWFFVIQEQPTEPRFGMDVANFDTPPPLTTWNNLGWHNMVQTPEELRALSHASTKTVLPVIDKAQWGRNSAHQAYITLQLPMRIAIHAAEMLLPEPPKPGTDS